MAGLLNQYLRGLACGRHEGKEEGEAERQKLVGELEEARKSAETDKQEAWSRGRSFGRDEFSLEAKRMETDYLNEITNLNTTLAETRAALREAKAMLSERSDLERIKREGFREGFESARQMFEGPISQDDPAPQAVPENPDDFDRLRRITALIDGAEGTLEIIAYLSARFGKY